MLALLARVEDASVPVPSLVGVFEAVAAVDVVESAVAVPALVRVAEPFAAVDVVAVAAVDVAVEDAAAAVEAAFHVAFVEGVAAPCCVV